MGNIAPRLRTKELKSIYDRYGALMFRRCRLITRDPNLADDAFQEGFLELIRRGSIFRKVPSKLRWLYTLCDRACFIVINRLDDIPNDEYVLDVLDDSENVEIRIEHRQSLREFWKALDEQEKTIAILKYVDGMAEEQIRETVGLTPQKIKNMLTKIDHKAESLSDGEEQDHA